MTAKKLFDMQFLLRHAAINQDIRFGPIVRVRRSDAPAQGLLSRNQARSPGATGKGVIELEMSGGSASKKTGNRTNAFEKLAMHTGPRFLNANPRPYLRPEMF